MLLVIAVTCTVTSTHAGLHVILERLGTSGHQDHAKVKTVVVVLLTIALPTQMVGLVAIIGARGEPCLKLVIRVVIPDRGRVAGGGYLGLQLIVADGSHNPISKNLILELGYWAHWGNGAMGQKPWGKVVT